MGMQADDHGAHCAIIAGAGNLTTVRIRAPVTAAAGAVVRFRLSKRMLVTVLQHHRGANVLYKLYMLPLQQLHTGWGMQSQFTDQNSCRSTQDHQPAAV
jgi:hypothetical protein